MNKEMEQRIQELIKSFVDTDYRLLFTYNTIEEVNEVVRLHGYGSYIENDMPTPYKATFNDNLYFRTNKNGLILDLMAKEIDGGWFELYGLTVDALNRYGL